MLGEEILYLTVGELAARIRAKAISPVELAESYLARSERLGPQLNAYVTLTPRLALAQARQAEKEIRAGHDRGPLHGIPYAAKDLLAVRGYPTTWGARPYADQRFDFDAAVIERLDRAGAVLIGKAAMIELAGGMGYRFASASVTGAAKNPWNETCWTCGSSSGSGAIAAGALAAFALGTETWGSIVCPSAYCGASGLRPTYGRVSRYGAMALSYSMDKIGPLGRAASDCALVLAAIAGHDPRDPASLPASEAAFHAAAAAARRARPLRVGWLAHAWQKVDPDIASAVGQALKTLEAHGARVEEATLPEGPFEEAANVVISVEGASAFNSLIASGRVAELADPLGWIGGYLNEEIAASDYLRAQRVRLILAHEMDRLFDRFDVLAAASLPVTATPLATNLETELAFPDPLGGIGNLCGLPAASVPCGFVRGLPAGIQFVGRARDDAAVLAAAELFQEHTGWNRRHPPLA
jgi:Asp-tRNA(Asn)/Glu-tRNA(Gln) amidotransferase A subunit family amidase